MHPGFDRLHVWMFLGKLMTATNPPRSTKMVVKSKGIPPKMSGLGIFGQFAQMFCSNGCEDGKFYIPLSWAKVFTVDVKIASKISA